MYYQPSGQLIPATQPQIQPLNPTNGNSNVAANPAYVLQQLGITCAQWFAAPSYQKGWWMMQLQAVAQEAQARAQQAVAQEAQARAQQAVGAVGHGYQVQPAQPTLLAPGPVGSSGPQTYTPNTAEWYEAGNYAFCDLYQIIHVVNMYCYSQPSQISGGLTPRIPSVNGYRPMF